MRTVGLVYYSGVTGTRVNDTVDELDAECEVDKSGDST